ncbi:Os07g0225800 [Oryza sativa Japonica Group]|uniref:Os07g0225800 protein n=2 Tax=Oryza TaxID=4527 RepID=A0A0P0X410_ORYSJ|nr:Os07g0225800 [Oryza sativa Japonica Group]
MRVDELASEARLDGSEWCRRQREEGCVEVADDAMGGLRLTDEGHPAGNEGRLARRRWRQWFRKADAGCSRRLVRAMAGRPPRSMARRADEREVGEAIWWRASVQW